MKNTVTAGGAYFMGSFGRGVGGAVRPLPGRVVRDTVTAGSVYFMGHCMVMLQILLPKPMLMTQGLMVCPNSLTLLPLFPPRPMR